MAAHNCESYGVSLTLYMLPEDWNQIEREYKVTDESGEVLFENNMEECADLGPYRTCKFYLSPDNPRMGFLMTKGAYGLLTYVARWVNHALVEEG